MKKAPSIYKLNDLIQHVKETESLINGKWVPTRSLGLNTLRSRIRCAWIVFKGKGDVVIWPENQ